MAVDKAAQGMAGSALRGRRGKRPIAIGIFGQSNERGNVLTSDKVAYPQAFGSLRNSAEIVPIGPSVSVSGGWWHHVYDVLYDAGYEASLVNGAIGSLSFLTQAAGYIQNRANSTTAYCNKRASVGPGDRGDAGDVITFGGKFFNVTAGGNNRSAINSGPQQNSGNFAAYVDYISGLSTGGTNAASAPDVSATAVGATVTDGALTLTCVNGAFYTGALNNVLTDSAGSMAGRGFDPLGLMQRLHEDMQRIRGVERKIIYVANGQTDLGIGAVTYGSAVQSIGLFFLARGYEVMIGLTCYSPGSSLSSSTNYGNLQTGVANAIAALSAAYPGKVHAGADLYALMGTTGPMGGSRIQFAVASNVLTVSSLFSGALEVGQTVATSAGAIVGTIASLGTGSGGTGTYNLTGGVDTASTTGRTVGAFLQALDGIHLNGAGVCGPDVAGVGCAGKHVAAAIRAIL